MVSCSAALICNYHRIEHIQTLFLICRNWTLIEISKTSEWRNLLWSLLKCEICCLMLSQKLCLLLGIPPRNGAGWFCSRAVIIDLFISGCCISFPVFVLWSDMRWSSLVLTSLAFYIGSRDSVQILMIPSIPRRDSMLRVDAKQSAPKDGRSPLESFEVSR